MLQVCRNFFRVACPYSCGTCASKWKKCSYNLMLLIVYINSNTGLGLSGGYFWGDEKSLKIRALNNASFKRTFCLFFPRWIIFYSMRYIDKCLNYYIRNQEFFSFFSASKSLVHFVIIFAPIDRSNRDITKIIRHKILKNTSFY